MGGDQNYQQGFHAIVLVDKDMNVGWYKILYCQKKADEIASRFRFKKVSLGFMMRYHRDKLKVFGEFRDR